MARISRRKFLKTSAQVAIGAGAVTLLGGADRLARALGPVEPAAAQSRPYTAALVRTRDRRAGMRAAVALLGLGQRSPFAGKAVVLKPNFNSADPYPGSTHSEMLAALVEWLRERGARSVAVADRSGMGNTRRVMEAKGVFDLGRRMGFEAVPIDELPAAEWERLPLAGGHWSHGVEIPRLFTGAQALVQTCCLKTHRFGGHFTMSLKNSVGMVAGTSARDGYEYMRELHASPNQRAMIAEINTAYTPDLVVLDALEAFVRGGPDRGTLERPGVIVAATNRVALDAVGVAMLRLYETTPEVAQGRIFEQAQIRRAVELGLGARGPEEIELVAAADGESQTYASRVREVLGKG